jgi:hypothetical protein
MECMTCFDNTCSSHVLSACRPPSKQAVFAFVLGRYRMSVIVPPVVLERVEDPPDEDPVVEASDVEVTEKDDEY